MEAEALNWQNWLTQAWQYETAAAGKTGVSSKLSPVVVYNLFSMALESYVMAILDFHGTLPDNHTFTDLLAGLEKIWPLDPVLEQQILDLEQYQQLCAFDDFRTAQPDTAANQLFREVVQVVGQLARVACNAAA